jgi:hypothetical protein
MESASSFSQKGHVDQKGRPRAILIRDATSEEARK